MSRTLMVTLWLLFAQPIGAETLTWQPQRLKLPGGRELEAQLGRLRVPENRTRPDSRSIEIAFIRLAGRAPGQAAPIVFLAGGPGGSGTAVSRSPEALSAWLKLTEIADVILLDQRSTGMSTPILACPPSPIPPDVVFFDRQRALQGATAQVRACAEEWRGKGADLSGYDTNESADDLESLRVALGVPRISLVGFSYGTHLGLAAIRRHPASLDRVVLIGTEGPNHTLKLPLTSQTQLEKLSLLASRDPAVAKDVPDMANLARELLTRLERAPLTIPVEDRQSKERVAVKIGRAGMQRILAWDIGDGNDFPLFPALLKMTRDGELGLLSQYVQKRWNQMTRGTALLPYLMDCASGVTATRLAQIRAESENATLGAAMNGPFPEICGALGVEALGDDFRSPIVSDVKTLFVSGTLDNNTPPFQAEELRWGMPNATHLIVENAGHEDTLPNPDVQRAIFDFFRGEDVGGRRIALPPRKFLSVETARKYELP